MNYLQNIFKNKELYNDLSSFLDEHGIYDLKKALQLYRNMHQSYICKTEKAYYKLTSMTLFIWKFKNIISLFIPNMEYTISMDH